MSNSNKPRPFEQWRTVPIERAEDAAHTFGYHLIKHCRVEVLDGLESAKLPTSNEELRSLLAAAIDEALHNVMDLVEGFWRTDAGPNHTVSFTLSVNVQNQNGQPVEQVIISPNRLDLPIGYWNWKDGEYQ
jgi:hypothetical protein